MKNKKIVSMIVMFSIFINIISGLHIDAQAENTENSETYLWDFSKYTDKITTTKTGFTEKYDGLLQITVMIAFQQAVYIGEAARQAVKAPHVIFHIHQQRMERCLQQEN